MLALHFHNCLGTVTVVIYVFLCFCLIVCFLFVSQGELTSPCILTQSGPITVTEDSTVIERLHIRSTVVGETALTVLAKNVTIRDLRIEHHFTGRGIYFIHADGILISGVEVVATGKALGPNNCSLPNNDCDNILGQQSNNVHLTGLRVEGGSTGIELAFCTEALVEGIFAKNNRGPFPRGQCVQFTHSDNSILQDFECSNDNTSWTEDNVNIWRSSNVTVRRGVVDGNNSPTGVGIMFEMSDQNTSLGLIEDVDALHQGDGCFSGYSARKMVMRRTRCAYNHCDGWSGRGKPTSNSLMWAAGDEDGIQSVGILVEDSQYMHACRDNIYWEQSDGGFLNDKVDVIEQNFQPRQPPNVSMCWDNDA